MKAVVLAIYGVSAFACGVWSRRGNHRMENFAIGAFVVAVICAAVLYLKRW